MRGTIAVWDPVPLVRAGLCGALGADARAVQPEKLCAWASSPRAQVAVISIVTALDWSLLGRVKAVNAGVLLVALLHWPGRAATQRALDLGATAALPRSSAVRDVARAVRTVRAGLAVIPREAIITRQLPPMADWTDEDRALLRALASGESVTDLAYRLGYSNRTAARRLRGLYLRLGVRRATEAAVAADRLGLLD